MSELQQFRLPDVGEGLTEADIVTGGSQPGDRVTVNQMIVEIETAKAVVELPCPFAGVVAGLLVPEGTTVDVGTPIIAVDVARQRARGSPACTAARRRSRNARPCWSATESSYGTPAEARPPRGSARRPPRRPRRRAATARTTRPTQAPPAIGQPRLTTGQPRGPRRAGQAAGPQAGQGLRR